MKDAQQYGWLPLAVFGLAVLTLGLIAALEAWKSARPPGPARPPWRRWPILVALGVAVVAASLVGAAYAYDASKAHVIAPGVRVGSFRVGGLSARTARIKLEHGYRPLYRPIVLRSRDRRFVLAPRQTGLEVDVDGAVSRALERSRSGWFLVRAAREVTGHKVHADVRPRITFSTSVVGRFVDRVESAVERSPRPAQVIPSADRLTVASGKNGLAVKSARLRRSIERSLTHLKAPRVLAVPTVRLRPRVTVADLARRYPAFITVDRGSFQLRVFQHLKLTRTYPIAVGQIGLATPAGLYHIQDKQVNPSWNVPLSAWAGSLAGQLIPPGPDDPLKARWLGIFNGAGIHGTVETWSIGHAVSHGCIRMTIPDVIDLYDRVQVGTPIYIG